jgi:hypothetical protein
MLRTWPHPDNRHDFKMVALICEVRMLAEEMRTSAGEGDETGLHCHCVTGKVVCGVHSIVQASIELVGPAEASIVIRTMADVGEGRKGRKVRAAL